MGSNVINSVAIDSSSEVGLAGSLLSGSIELLACTLKSSRRLDRISNIQNRSLQRLLERLLLWGTDFDYTQGTLDRALTHSESPVINSLVVQILSAIGKSIVFRT